MVAKLRDLIELAQRLPVATRQSMISMKNIYSIYVF
jgi:hypothetical protein